MTTTSSQDNHYRGSFVSAPTSTMLNAPSQHNQRSHVPLSSSQSWSGLSSNQHQGGETSAGAEGGSTRLAFKEHVQEVSGWFSGLRGCEQVLVLVSLMRRLYPAYLKMFGGMVDQAATRSFVSDTELGKLESQANDIEYLYSLYQAPRGQMISRLLQALPLLGSSAASHPHMHKLYMDLLFIALTGNSNLSPASGYGASANHSGQRSDIGPTENEPNSTLPRSASGPLVANEEVMQLVSLALVHPCLTQEDRGLITQLLLRDSQGHQPPPHSRPPPLSPSPSTGYTTDATFVQRQGQLNHQPAPTRTDSGLGLDISSCSDPLTPSPVPPHLVSPTCHQPSVSRDHRPLTRQLSLAPPPSFHHSTDTHFLTTPTHHSNQPPPLSPQSSVSSGGGGDAVSSCGEDMPHPAWPVHSSHSGLTQEHKTTTDTSVSGTRNTFLEEASGMKNVPSWLKSLRLHKYAYLFQQLTYEEMLDISEDWLESKKVTRGARNKLLVSIRRLRERENTLLQVEQEISQPGGLHTCVTELRDILSSPLKPSAPPSGQLIDSTGNLGSDTLSNTEGYHLPSGVGNGPECGDVTGDTGIPGHVIRCMGKVCSHLLVSRQFDDESYAIFVQLIDSVLDHWAFSSRQKNLCGSWKQQMENVRGPPLRKFLWDVKAKKTVTACSSAPSSCPSQSVMGQLGPNLNQASPWSWTGNTSSLIGNQSRPIRPLAPVGTPGSYPWTSGLLVPPGLPTPSWSAHATFMKQHSLATSEPPLTSYATPYSTSGAAVPPPQHSAMFPHHLLHHQATAAAPLHRGNHLKRQVERTHSAPSRETLHTLFNSDFHISVDHTMNEDPYPPECTDSLYGGTPAGSSDVFYSRHCDSSMSSCLSIPDQHHSHYLASAELDGMSTGDRSTAEITRNLDLLARKVTELAIDSDTGSDVA